MGNIVQERIFTNFKQSSQNRKSVFLLNGCNDDMMNISFIRYDEKFLAWSSNQDQDGRMMDYDNVMLMVMERMYSFSTYESS